LVLISDVSEPSIGSIFFAGDAMKMEPIEGSETSAFKPQTPVKYPKENILHNEHGESLKSRTLLILYVIKAYKKFLYRYFDMVNILKMYEN
jgi:hypothetical protein